MTQATAPALFDRHRDRLDGAREALRTRDYWSAFPESPSPRVYGDTAAAGGEAAFRGYLDADFPLDQPGAGRVVTERSPYGIELNVAYPHADAETLLRAASDALPRWRDAGPEERVGVCLEILDRLHKRIFELAYAVQFTTGQAFVMAFQAGGAHALDRALEAIAVAYDAMTQIPGTATWTKPAGKGDPLRMAKEFHIVPRGVALVIGCNTFPTWNSWPGLFASLVTGNPVIVKPHPGAVLPLAITVAVAREVLAEAGHSPDVVGLAAEERGEGLASVLATDPRVRLVDYTGSTEYGDWLESHARQATVFTEKAGVNTVLVDSTDDFAGMCRNLAFSLTLYSGQMCTAPQTILVPADGIDTGSGRLSFDEVSRGIADAVAALTADDARAVELTGAIVNEAVLERVNRARSLGTVLLDSRELRHPNFADAVARTPLVIMLDADAAAAYGAEWFGPIAFIVPTANTAHSIAILRDITNARGALTTLVYSTDNKVVDEVTRAALDVGTHLSINLTGGVFVNQSTAFSDFHATGANPAANASLTDCAFVANRFRIVQSRSHSTRP
ncbi:phenylacetic acid degradation protein PaaN [Luedemannella helvata]|uniref:Phenylacetic acid degradation protein PaaN n=1 Tax=Luedemannella helvata TaxID=349315 RepID=A0ABP4WL08_9ACTN